MDKLEKLEAYILKYYQKKGYVICVGTWGFKVWINSYYKEKELNVGFHNGKDSKMVFKVKEETLSEMFEKAFEFFELKSNCCSEPIIEETTLCSKCKEHCEVV